MSTHPILPDALYHYYECARGPFRSLSDLPPDQAERVLADIRRAGGTFASQRSPDYLVVRMELEERARRLFVAKGGRPRRRHPHSMILGACSWVRAWYRRGCVLAIPLARFDPAIVSFTYGDIFPAMRVQDGRPYRGQVYTLRELPDLVARYGLPQERNPDGDLGPERYIEAQVWDDAPLAAYREGARPATGQEADLGPG
jgi:hypothetical protein